MSGQEEGTQGGTSAKTARRGMSEPKALRIVIPWIVIARVAFMVLCSLLVVVAYTLALPQWPTWAIKDIATGTAWCALFSWFVAGGRIA